MSAPVGRHSLQIPGPTNVPDDVLRAIAAPTIDHRSQEFAAMGRDVLERIAPVFGTSQPIVIYPGSGTGAWEAALVNTLSPGDEVLAFETGHFATLWADMASALGLVVHMVPGDWRHGADPAVLAERLSADTKHAIQAVCVVHNETSTGVTSQLADIRAALDDAGHPALLLVDTISSLGSVDFQHDQWGVDVTIACSQKGLMLPPGLGFNAVSAKALEASRSARLPRSYWDWVPILKSNRDGFWPSTPSTNLLYGLGAALTMLENEGLKNVFARHLRHAAATRAAAQAWGLEVVCLDPREYSPALTALLVPDGHDADDVRRVILDELNMSLGAGLGKWAGKVFRIGHLGHFNDVALLGTLAGIQLGLRKAGVPIQPGGVDAALAELASP